jgi:hypothetical protein
MELRGSSSPCGLWSHGLCHGCVTFTERQRHEVALSQASKSP